MCPSLLIVHNQYRVRGGEESVIDQQLHHLRFKGHAVHCYFEDSNKFLTQPIAPKIKQACQMPFSFHHYWGLKKKIREMKPSLVHFHNIFPLLTPSVYYAARAMRVPIVQSLHNYRFLCSNGLFLLPNGSVCERCCQGNHMNAVRFGCYGGRRFGSLGMAFTLMLHRGLDTFRKTIDAFIAPSLFLKKKFMEAGFPERKIFHVPNGLAPLSPRFHEQEEKTLVYVGRLSREKGLATLLRAAKVLPEWSFEIIGDGPLREDIEKEIRAESLKNVHLHGGMPPSRVHPFLQKATYLVLPSECYENMPTVILEAWFYGLPVIVSRLGGMAELVQENVTGFFMEAGHSESLVNVLKKLNVQKSRSLRESIKEHFDRNYSIEANYQKIMAVYERVLSIYQSCATH